MMTRPACCAPWSTGRPRAGPIPICSPPRRRSLVTAGCARTSTRRPPATTPTSRLGDALLVVRRRQASRNLRLVYDALHRRRPDPAAGVGGRRGPRLAGRGRAGEPLDRAPGRGREQGPASPGGDPGDRHPGAVPVPAGRQPRAHRARHVDRPRAIRPAAGGGPPRGRRHRPVVARDAAGGVADGPRPPELDRDGDRRVQPAHGDLRARGSSRRSPSSTRSGRASCRASATSGSSSPSDPGGSGSSRRSPRASRPRMPALASQVSERDIVRAGIDPATLTPAEVYAAKLVLAIAILGIGLALTPAVRVRAASSPCRSPSSATSSRPSTSARWAGAARRSCCVSCRTSSRSSGRWPNARGWSRRSRPWPTSSMRRRTARTCSPARSARPSPPTAPGPSSTAPSRDVAAASDVEELDELASGAWSGSPDRQGRLRRPHRARALAPGGRAQPPARRGLDRPAEARRDPGRHLPAEFLVLVVVPLFLSTLGRI